MKNGRPDASLFYWGDGRQYEADLPYTKQHRMLRQSTQETAFSAQLQDWAHANGLAKLPAYRQKESTMGLFRLLFWIAIIAAAFWLWRRFTRTPTARPEDRNTGAAPMVRCAHCGTHVPRSHALAKDEQWFCSQTHLEQGAQSGER